MLAGFVCALLPAVCAGQSAATPTRQPVAFTLALDVSSRYLFSGLTFSPEPVAHPSLAASRGGWTLTAYGTYYTETDELAEADVFAEYTRDVGNVSVYGGVSRYHFKYDEGWRGTFEAYVAATWNVAVYPTLTLTEDFGLGRGGTVEISVTRPWTLWSRPLSATLSLVHNHRYYSALSGLSHVALGVEAELAFGRVTLVPKLVGIAPLRDDVERTLGFGAEARLEL